MITTSQQLFDITPAMRETWLYIAAYITEHGYPPTTQEIQQHFNLGYRRDAFERLEDLQAYGIITRKAEDRGKIRAYSLFVWPRVQPVCATPDASLKAQAADEGSALYHPSLSIPYKE